MYFFVYSHTIWAHNLRGRLMRSLRCLPPLVQGNRRNTKGYPGCYVESGMLRAKGLVLGAASPSSYYLFLLYLALHTIERDPNLWNVLWSILKVIVKTDLSYLLSLVFVSLTFFLLANCFPSLFFCFYLYLNWCLARECTYCQFRNVFRLALSDVSLLQEVVFVVLGLS